MADEKIEQKPQVQEKKEEQKKPTTLESVVNETGSLFKTAGGAAALAGSYAFAGTGGLAVAASRPFGALMTQEKFSFIRESIFGLAQVPVYKSLFDASLSSAKSIGLEKMLNIGNYALPISSLAAGGLTLAATPLLTAIFYPIGYFTHAGTLKGFAKYFRENYAKDVYKTLWWSVPMAGAVASTAIYPFIAPYLLPIAAGANLFYRLMASKQIYLQNLLKPVTYPISGTLSLVGKIYRRAATVVYDIGSAVRGLFEKTTQASEPKPA